MDRRDWKAAMFTKHYGMDKERAKELLSPRKIPKTSTSEKIHIFVRKSKKKK